MRGFPVASLLLETIASALAQIYTALPTIAPHRNGPQIFVGYTPANGGSNGCINPSIRREWRTMTDAEKETWISAVKCLVRLPSSGILTPTANASGFVNANPPVNTSGSWYDDLSYAHMDLNPRIHQTGLFLPWHRYFVWSFEQSLGKLCGYTGSSPYWDWTQDAPDFRNATIFSDNASTGLGGFGDPARDHAVLDGGFAMLPLSYPILHTLRRAYTPYPFVNLTPPHYTNPTLAAADAFTAQEVQKMVGAFEGDFKGFQSYIEAMEGAHMSAHYIVGGDLAGTCPRKAQGTPVCTPDAKWSPNDPMFWLHHAMVDKIWYDWQHAHPDNFWAFEAGTVRELDTWPKYTNGAPPAMTPQFKLPTDGILVGNYTVGDVFNTTSNGPLCYVYD